MLSLAIVDAKIWSPDLLLGYLYQQFEKGEPAEIDFTPEATCLHSANVYNILDKFCTATGYNKSKITIHTANLIEHHTEYNIKKDVHGWYELPAIQKWLREHSLSNSVPTKHFANFVSRNHWSRLWIATILYSNYADKTLQTYNYFNSTENYNIDRYVGLDELIIHNCPLVAEAVQFLASCPRTLEAQEFPIQHPTNLNLLKYYPEIFVDVVVETNVTGNSFLVTEKTWRPIVAQRPFIIMGNRDYLKNLRKLGFKTFNEYWIETYDNLSGADRIKSIHEILEQISRYSVDQLQQILTDMQEILNHNYNTFINLSPQKIKQVF